MLQKRNTMFDRTRWFNLSKDWRMESLTSNQVHGDSWFIVFSIDCWKKGNNWGIIEGVLILVIWSNWLADWRMNIKSRTRSIEQYGWSENAIERFNRIENWWMERKSVWIGEVSNEKGCVDTRNADRRDNDSSHKDLVSSGREWRRIGKDLWMRLKEQYNDSAELMTDWQIWIREEWSKFVWNAR